MKDNRGQALVEFIILLPILIMILFIIIDFGTVVYQKNKLENISTDIVNIYNSNEKINNDLYDDVNIKLNKKGKYVEITVDKKLNLLTPGLSKTELSTISTKRIIYER